MYELLAIEVRRNLIVLGLLICVIGLSIGSLSITDVFAAVDSKGTEFYIAFLSNYSGGGKLQLHISSDFSTKATVTYPANNPTFNTTVDVTPGQITVVDIPHDAQIWNQGTPDNNLVKVTSPQEVTVYTSNLQSATSDAGMALPTDAFSFKYIDTSFNGRFSHSQLVVVAPFDNTEVTINPSTNLSTGQQANIPFIVNLNSGEGYSVQTPGTQDLSGSIITATKPIGLSNGDGCTQVPTGTVYCDHIYEHGIPVQGWGNKVLVAPLPDRPNGNVYRIYSSEDNTAVSIDGANVATLDEGEFYQTSIISGGHVITGNKPIFVSQFYTGIGSPGATNGDPAMANIVPTEQYLNSYTFAPVGGNQFVRNFVTIIAANSDISSITFDGSTIGENNFTPIGSSGFSYTIIDNISQGTHKTSSTNGHGILVGGLNQADSYLYPGGAAFEFINPQPKDDRDGDGVPDINDQCPDEYGETENGCPVKCVQGETFSAFYDFNSEEVPSEFTYPDDPQINDDGHTGVSGFDQYGFSGQFLRDTSSDNPTNEGYSSIPLESIKLNLTDLPEHDTIDISFLLAIIDSWDSDDSGTIYSPDYFNVKVDGNTVFNSTFNNQLGSHDYGDINPDAVIVRDESIGFNGGWTDSAYDLDKESSLKGIPHTGSNATIEWTASGEGWQGGNDESWAIDNVKISANNSCEVAPKPETQHRGSDNQWDTRPTFGISNEDRETQLVDSGFSFNGQYFTITDNHHTPFEKQSVEIGTENTFSAKVYADKRLHVQEFLFGIPEVGEAQLAELGVEVWYDFDGNITDVKVAQKSDVIDPDTVNVSHEKSKCKSIDPEPVCDTTTVSMTFLEPLKDNVMAIKAIDFARRDQSTFLNEGFDISGKSLNPMLTQMIPSNIKNHGLLKITQLAKYSPYWQSDDGRMFEMNSFGSFKEINQKFERFQDAGDARTRLHSGFAGIMEQEKEKATDVYDASQYQSELAPSFAYIFPDSGERISEDMLQKMLEQEQIAKGVVEQMDKQNRYY